MTANNTLSKTISITLGFSAAWYLATHLTLRGSVAAGPILIFSLFALVAWLFSKEKAGFRQLTTNEKLWALLLFLFGTWSAFTVWLDSGATNLYEVPAKFIVGSLIAIPLLAKGINLNWIKVGVLAGCSILAYLIISNYGGGGRFSPIMNATKWGNTVAFQTLLTFCIAVIEKNRAQKILFLTLGIGGIYATLITGTRGATLPLLAAPFALAFIYRKSLNLKYLLGGLVSLVIIITIASQLTIVQSRMSNTFSDFKQMENDNHYTSIGIRLTMWRAGIQAAIHSPLAGHGYDFKSVFTNYEAPTPGLAHAADRIGDSFRLFHSAYIDTLVKTGFVGFFLFLGLLATGFWSGKKYKMLICMAPTVGFSAAGLTDSALALGITSTYLIVAGTILKATRVD